MRLIIQLKDGKIDGVIIDRHRELLSVYTEEQGQINHQTVIQSPGYVDSVIRGVTHANPEL